MLGRSLTSLLSSLRHEGHPHLAKWKSKAKGVGEGTRVTFPQQPYDFIYMWKQKTRMPMWGNMKATTTKGYLGLTSTAPHPMLSNWLSFTSLPRDHHDDATCTIHHRSTASFEAKLWNPSPTCFMTKQATGCRHMTSHHLHPLISFEAQTKKPPPLGFEGQTKKSARCFWGLNHQTINLSFEAQTKKLS
jgi:hypothetical protein